jgi:benzodiazapine receptor
VVFSRDVVRQGLSVLAFLTVIAVNVLANALPINGRTTGDLAGRYPVWIQPAGYAFSIWSIIYLALAAFTFYQALPAQRENPHLRWIGWLFVLTCLANVCWIFFWHYERVPLSLAAMVTLLGALIAIYLRLDPVRSGLPLIERWVVALPFSLYLGWITIATLVNVAVTIYDQNLAAWDAGPAAWTIALLGLAAVVTAVMGALRADVAFALVVVWAAVAIVMNNEGRPLVIGSAVGVALFALLAVGLGAFRARQAGRPVAP